MSAHATESARMEVTAFFQDAQLSEELRTHTAAAHSNAEESSFVAELMGGQLDTKALASLLAQSLVIYRALEKSLDLHADNAQLAPFIDVKLSRVAALEEDMAYHFGPNWEAKLSDGSIAIVPATQAYAEKLTTLGAESIEFLMAQHYVRYMGDLSGGQIISRMVQRHYGVADAGLNFYAFPEIPKPKPYKDAYRQLLDTANFTRQQKDVILDFASDSFELNRLVFVDLAADRSRAVAV